MAFSAPHMDATAAFIVKDHRRHDFATLERIRKLDSPRIGIGNSPHYRSLVRDVLPRATFVVLDSPRDFFGKKGEDLDALLGEAEAGSAWTLIYPRYAVVVPRPEPLAIPVAYPMPRGDREMVDFVSTWVQLMKKDQTIDAIYDHWILGKLATGKEPRWSVIRNVLHWVD